MSFLENAMYGSMHQVVEFSSSSLEASTCGGWQHETAGSGLPAEHEATSCWLQFLSMRMSNSSASRCCSTPDHPRTQPDVGASLPACLILSCSTGGQKSPAQPRHEPPQRKMPEPSTEQQHMGLPHPERVKRAPAQHGDSCTESVPGQTQIRLLCGNARHVGLPHIGRRLTG